MCHAYQSNSVKNILIECADLAHLKETFYSANEMKELIQRIEMKYVNPFLKAVNLYGKILKNFQQDEIPSTNCSSSRNNSTKAEPFHQKIFLLQDNSLQINFKWNQILSTNHFPTNKFQHNRRFCFPLLKPYLALNERESQYGVNKTKNKTKKKKNKNKWNMKNLLALLLSESHTISLGNMWDYFKLQSL